MLTAHCLNPSIATGNWDLPLNAPWLYALCLAMNLVGTEREAISDPAEPMMALSDRDVIARC